MTWDELGAISEAATAALAFAALAVAGWAARATVLTNRAQQETLALQLTQLDQQRQQLLRSHAERVAVWARLQRQAGGLMVHIFVSNASDLPLYRAHFDIAVGRGPAVNVADVEVILPNNFGVQEPQPIATVMAPDGISDAHSPHVHMVFWDAKGGWWMRSSDGELVDTGVYTARQFIAAEELRSSVVGSVSTGPRPDPLTDGVEMDFSEINTYKSRRSRWLLAIGVNRRSTAPVAQVPTGAKSRASIDAEAQSSDEPAVETANADEVK